MINIVGDPSGPKAVSLIAIHQHGIPHQFPEDVLNESENSHFSVDAKREDLTKIPFVTIDPSDARDHDDAVYLSSLIRTLLMSEVMFCGLR